MSERLDDFLRRADEMFDPRNRDPFRKFDEMMGRREPRSYDPEDDLELAHEGFASCNSQDVIHEEFG